MTLTVSELKPKCAAPAPATSRSMGTSRTTLSHDSIEAALQAEHGAQLVDPADGDSAVIIPAQLPMCVLLGGLPALLLLLLAGVGLYWFDEIHDMIAALWHSIRSSVTSETLLFVGGALAAYPYSATCVTVAAVMRFGCSMRGLHEALSLLTGMLPSWCCRCIAPSQPEDEFEPSRRAAALV